MVVEGKKKSKNMIVQLKKILIKKSWVKKKCARYFQIIY